MKNTKFCIQVYKSAKPYRLLQCADEQEFKKLVRIFEISGVQFYEVRIFEAKIGA